MSRDPLVPLLEGEHAMTPLALYFHALRDLCAQMQYIVESVMKWIHLNKHVFYLVHGIYSRHF